MISIHRHDFQILYLVPISKLLKHSSRIASSRLLDNVDTDYPTRKSVRVATRRNRHLSEEVGNSAATHVVSRHSLNSSEFLQVANTIKIGQR